MSTTHPVDVVEAYINDVRARLADIPEEDRAELLEDVAAHVREIAVEFGADELATRLGTPEEFTNELRASAGYVVRGDAIPAATSGVLRRAWLRTTASIKTDANQELWRKLEPGWFVARGGLAGYVFAEATNAAGVFALAAVVAGAVASYKLGDRRPAVQAAWVRRARVAGEVGLVLAALAMFDSSGDRVVYNDVGYVERDPCLRDSAGQPIGNLYAFDPSGKLIPQFFLTDQAGRPINNLCPDQVTKNGMPIETEYARDANGSPVYGVFPRAQNAVNPGDGQKTPVAPPAVVLPQLAPTTTAAPATELPAP